MSHSIKIYRFSGYDQNSQAVDGTIEAMSEYAAYKRLRREFHFTIEDINLNDHQSANEQSRQSKISQLETSYLEEFPDRHSRKASLLKILKNKIPSFKRSSKLATKEWKANEPSKPHVTLFSIEISSFISWLLSFYIFYYFLVSFSLEKGVGLNKTFVNKTLSNPLLLNITLLLVILKFSFYLKHRYLNKNLAATLFLILFNLTLYTFIVKTF